MAENAGDIVYTVSAEIEPLVESAGKVDTQLDAMGASAKKADTQTAKLSKTAKSVKSSLSGAGRGAGQAAIQIQQLVGQIQGGQSAMLALSQQSADLGFVLGVPLLGAVTGIAAALVGMLIPSLLDSEEQTEKLTEKLKELVKASTLTEAQSAFLVNQTNDEIQANRDLVDESEERIKALTDQIEKSEELASAAYSGIQLSKEEAAAKKLVSNEIDELKDKLIEEKAARDTLESEFDNLTRKRAAYTIATQKSLEQQDEETKSLVKAKTAVESFSDAIDIQVATLGMSEREAAQYKAALLGVSEETKNQIDLIYDYKEALEAEAEAKKKSREEEQARQSALSAAVSASPALAAGFGREGELAALQATYDAGIISEQEYLAQKLSINQDYEEQIRQLQEERFRRESEGNAFIIDTLNDLESAGTNAITGLLTGVTSVKEVFSALANTVLNSAVGALVELGVQQLKNQIIGESAAAASVATAAATGASLSAIYATPATLASIATLGTAAATGQAAVTAAVAASKTLGIAARERGGPVSAGSMYRMGEGNKPEILQTSSGLYGIPGDNGRVFNSQQLDNIGGSGGFNITIQEMPGTVVTVVSQDDQGAIVRAAVSEAVATTRSEFQTSMSNKNGVYFNATAQNYGRGKGSGRNF